MVPVIIRGTRQMMPKGKLTIKNPGEVIVEFLPVVWPKNYSSREELMDAVRARMEAALQTT